MGFLRTKIPIFLGHHALFDQFFGTDQFIVFVGFGGRGQQIASGQLDVFNQPIGQRVATVFSYTFVVMCPNGGPRTAGHVTPHHKFNGKGDTFPAHGDVGAQLIQSFVFDDVVGHNVFGLVKPPRRCPVEDRPFEGNGGQLTVKRRKTVTGNEADHRSIVVTVSDFANVFVDGAAFHRWFEGDRCVVVRSFCVQHREQAWEVFLRAFFGGLNEWGGRRSSHGAMEVTMWRTRELVGVGVVEQGGVVK